MQALAKDLRLFSASLNCSNKISNYYKADNGLYTYEFFKEKREVFLKASASRNPTNPFTFTTELRQEPKLYRYRCGRMSESPTNELCQS